MNAAPPPCINHTLPRPSSFSGDSIPERHLSQDIPANKLLQLPTSEVVRGGTINIAKHHETVLERVTGTLPKTPTILQSHGHFLPERALLPKWMVEQSQSQSQAEDLRLQAQKLAPVWNCVECNRRKVACDRNTVIQIPYGSSRWSICILPYPESLKKLPY